MLFLSYIWWDVYCVNEFVVVDLSGWVGVGLGGNCDVGVVTYMLLCWWGWGFRDWMSDIFSLSFFSLCFETFCSRRGVGLPQGFCYVWLCVGLANLV